jgi:uncharacterized membrane protein YhaH (DUF805 family)
MTERAFKVMGLIDRHPFFYACIAFTLIVIALELIGWHLDHSDTFCKLE